jgi:tRNA-2-methylthio-N6-dimethylallyladenosine synthase
VGTRQRILVTGHSRKAEGAEGAVLAGRTENNRVVNFAAPAGPTPSGGPAAASRSVDSLVGQFVDVEIVRALTNTLRGRLCG